MDTQFGLYLVAYILVLGGVITGLMGVIKVTGKVKPNWIPSVAILVGLVVGFISSFMQGALGMIDMTIAGGIAGLVSSGYFEVGTNREKKYGEDDK